MNELLLIITSIASLAALTLSVINFQRITKNKKQTEINLENHMDDVKLTMNKFKANMGREVKNMKRNQSPASPKPGNKKPQKPNEQNDGKGNEPKAVKSQEGKTENNGEAPKKKPARKPSRNRRRPPVKTDGNNPQAANTNSNKEHGNNTESKNLS